MNVEFEAIVRKQTRNLTSPQVKNDDTHGVEISIVVVVGVTAVVPNTCGMRKYSVHDLILVSSPHPAFLIKY